MNRAIILQTLNLTKSKKVSLKEFSLKAVELASLLLSKRKSKKLMDLHRETYLTSKKRTSFNSQVICDIERSVVKSRGNTLKGITVKFNVPRNCKIFETKKNFFVRLGMYPGTRLPIQIKKNRNYERYCSLINNRWTCKTYGLTPKLEIVAYLSKEETIIPKRKNVLGIDINSKCFAISVLSPIGKVLKQTYFGKDIWIKRKKIFERREKLQSLADTRHSRAIRSLAKLKTREHNFVKNRIGEIVRDITNLAIKFNADISIENLQKFSSKGKRFNKIVMRIPFYTFRKNLENRCFDKKITLKIIDAYHTSKWCSHCGAVTKGHSSNYSLFKCKCGQIVNSDRKASLAVAVKSLLERNTQAINHNLFFQFSNRRVSVNRLFRRNDEFFDKIAVQHNLNPPIESPLL